MAYFRKEFSLDKLDLNGKLIGIFESPEADGNFIINYFLWEASRDQNQCSCLIALKHNFNHYFQVGLKFGYNLVTQKNRTFVLNILDAMVFETEQSWDFSAEDKVKNLFLILRENLSNLQRKFQKVFLIIDDLTYLQSLGFPVEDVLKFCHYLRTLQSFNVTIVILLHYSDEVSVTLGLKSYVEQYSDFKFYVSSLKTGSANDITGAIRMTRKLLTMEEQSASIVKHYKLTNKTIRVFSPGSI